MGCQSFANVGNTPPPPALSLFTLVAFAVIGIITTSGNLCVVITIIKDPLSKLHNSFNYFLLSLALSDLLLGVVTMPIGVVSLMREYFKEREIMSELLHLTMFISGTASLLSLIALSVDRFVAVTLPLKYKRLLTGLRSAVTCGCIWVLSVILPFLYFVLDYTGYLMFFAHSAIFIAFLIIITTHIQTKRYLRNNSEKMIENIASSSPDIARKAIEAREQQFQNTLSKVQMLILLFFVGIYIPAVIMTYVLIFCSHCDCTVRHVLRDLAFVLISSNSCVNPIIYAFRVRSFRASLKATFCNGL